MHLDRSLSKYDTEDDLMAPRLGVLTKQEKLYVDIYKRNLKNDAPVQSMKNIINEISKIYEKYPDIIIWDE